MMPAEITLYTLGEFLLSYHGGTPCLTQLPDMRPGETYRVTIRINKDGTPEVKKTERTGGLRR